MNTNDQPSSISINQILTAPFTRVGSNGAGDSKITLWEDAKGTEAIETNGDPVFPGAYGFDAARILIVGDYSNFTTYLSSDVSSTKPLVESDAAEVLSLLVSKFGAAMIGQHAAICDVAMAKLESGKSGVKKKINHCLGPSIQIPFSVYYFLCFYR